jgi:hypothetical protein
LKSFKLIKFTSILYCAALLSFGPNVHALEELPRFKWDKVINTPPAADSNQSFQVLHFRTKSKDYNLDARAISFVNKNMSKAKQFISDADVTRFAVDQATLDGTFVELGFCTGKTINFIAALKPTKIIYGFDSFEGMAEDWDKGYVQIRKGTFKVVDQNFVPPVLNNVKLYKGWFKDTLPKFVEEILQDKPIAFLHVDCEIYSSTKEAFDALHNHIVPGTVILFDEFYNYPEFEKHEYKAFVEFLKSKNLKAEYLGFNKKHEQVVIRVVS